MQMMNDIYSYLPYNKQEIEDKKNIIEYINTYGVKLFSRDNNIAHFTASSFIVNKTFDKTLMIYHKLRNTWSWTGGHLEEEETFLETAIRESKEELGIETITTISDAIFSIDILPMEGHIKNGKYLSTHLHLSIAYLLVVDEHEELNINLGEAKSVKWIKFEDINETIFSEIDTVLYQKLISKIKKLM